MPKVAYVDKTFRDSTLSVIAQANEILDEYARQGFVLTLRQLYYQFVARGLIENRQREYKRLGSIVNDARLAGLIDWNHLEDRTRNLMGRNWVEGPEEAVQSAARSFCLDLWRGQEYRPEVWIEKDALVGVIEKVCRRWDVDYFSCRGYVSQSELWGSAQRYRSRNHRTVIIHLGDHDPSGIDMTRDIGERQDLFQARVRVVRIALNMDQVEQYEPPPNPAKLTDSRCEGYIRRHGRESWELDALEPKVLDSLIDAEIRKWCDEDLWNERLEEQEEKRGLLKRVSDDWSEVLEALGEQ